MLLNVERLYLVGLQPRPLRHSGGRVYRPFQPKYARRRESNKKWQREGRSRIRRAQADKTSQQQTFELHKKTYISYGLVVLLLEMPASLNKMSSTATQLKAGSQA